MYDEYPEAGCDVFAACTVQCVCPSVWMHSNVPAGVPGSRCDYYSTSGWGVQERTPISMGSTLISLAKRYWLIPIGLRNSSRRISPG